MQSSDKYLSIRLASISAITLAFFIASFFINRTINDRQELFKKVKGDIALSWAGKQTMIGPILAVPYVEHLKNGRERDFMLLLPDSFDVKINSESQIRSRGIFDIPVYESNIEMKCSFNPEILSHSLKADAIDWRSAKFIICISEPKGLKDVEVKFLGLHLPINPGIGALNTSLDGINIPVNLEQNWKKSFDIKFQISLKGSESFSIVPIGKTNNINAVSNWPDPSFVGYLLPDTKTINKQGFKAEWTVNSLAVNFPDVFSAKNLDKMNMQQKSLGIRLVKPADHYQQTERCTKYSFLFIIYTFLIFFLYETIKKIRIHILQYCVVAAALLYFPILLISIAEHLSFETAFWIASIAVISQCSFYVFGFLEKLKERLFFTCILTILYLYLFIVLRLEEMAFLVGSIGMFLGIAITMIYTRKLDKL